MWKSILLAILLPFSLITGCVSSKPNAAPATRPTRGVLAPLTKPTVPPATQPAYSLSNFTEQTLPAAEGNQILVAVGVK